MNRILTAVLIVLAIVLMAYNTTLVNFQDPFAGESTVAMIGIVAPLCAIVLLLIFITSKKIQKKVEKD